MLAIILPGSWAEGFSGGFKPQFFPELPGISALFSRAATAASLWVHLLAVNLFAARAFFLDGKFMLACLDGAPHSVLQNAACLRLMGRSLLAKDAAGSQID
jgi:hypothetical protein